MSCENNCPNCTCQKSEEVAGEVVVVDYQTIVGSYLKRIGCNRVTFGCEYAERELSRYLGEFQSAYVCTAPGGRSKLDGMGDKNAYCGADTFYPRKKEAVKSEH